MMEGTGTLEQQLEATKVRVSKYMYAAFAHFHSFIYSAISIAPLATYILGFISVGSLVKVAWYVKFMFYMYAIGLVLKDG